MKHWLEMSSEKLKSILPIKQALEEKEALKKKLLSELEKVEKEIRSM